MAKRGGFPGGMPGNMANIMKQAQKMQKQMEEAQKNLEEQEVTAAAGGGAVDIGSEHKFHNFSVPFFFYVLWCEFFAAFLFIGGKAQREPVHICEPCARPLHKLYYGISKSAIRAMCGAQRHILG